MDRVIGNPRFPLRTALLVAVIMVSLLVWAIYDQTNTLMTRQFGQQQHLLATHATAVLANFLNDIEKEASALADSYGLQGCPRSDYSLLERFVFKRSPLVGRVILVDGAGAPLCLVDRRGAVTAGTAEGRVATAALQPLSGDVAFTGAAAAGRPFWGTIRRDLFGSTSATLSVPVLRPPSGRGAAPEVDSVMIFYLSAPEMINTFLSPTDPQTGGYSWVLDAGGRIIAHSTMPELVGRDALELSRQEGGPELSRLMSRMLCGETGTGVYVFRGVRKNMAFSPMRAGGLNWSVAVTTPVSRMLQPLRVSHLYYLFLLWSTVVLFGLLVAGLARVSREAWERNRELGHLYRIRTAFASSKSSEEMIDRILESVLHLESVKSALLFLHDEPTGQLRRVGSRNLSPEFLEMLGRLPAGHSPEQQAFAERRSVRQEKKAPAQEAPGPAGASWLAVPILLGDKPLGVLSLGAEAPGVFTDDYLRFVETLARDLAVVINNISLLQALRDRTRDLERASRVKSEFLAMVSHELRTPLSVIVGFLDLLKEGRFAGRPREMEDLGGVAARRARDLERLINDLLDLTRIEEGRLQTTIEVLDPKRAMQSVHRLFLPQADRDRIALRLELPRKISSCLGDSSKLERVLDNLVGNALKFTPPGGAVTLGVESGDAGVVFRVADTGPGIPPDKLETIFERFYQVDSSMTRTYGGAGLGLAISRELARLMGGSLTAANRPGGGAVFSLALPATRPGAGGEKAPSRRGAAPAQLAPPAEGRVLVIDEDADLLRVLTMALEDRGLAVLAETGGVAGLGRLYGEGADLVILDLALTGFGSRQFLRALSADHGPPVIVTTAGRETLKDLAEFPGVRAVFAKPCPTADLVVAVFSILRGSADAAPGA